MGKRVSRAKRIAIVCVAAGVVLTWSTWPRIGQFAEISCSPTGVVGEISAMIHGSRWWQVQYEHVHRQRIYAENWDIDQAEIAARIAPTLAQTDEMMSKVNADIEELFRKYPSLVPSSADRLAQRMRKQADAIDYAEVKRKTSELMRARVSVLTRCESVISEVLR